MDGQVSGRLGERQATLGILPLYSPTAWRVPMGGRFVASRWSSRWPWATLGEPLGYDPFQAGRETGLLLAGIRLLGATAVVPVMEELF